MDSPITVEVTFRSTAGDPETDLPRCEGVVRMPDGHQQGFSGWMDLLATLERVARSGGVTGAR